MTRIAVVTAKAARALDEDLPPLELALRRRSVDYAIVDWDDARIEWSTFDLAIIRSTWDYTARVQEFLSWAEQTSRRTTLLNPLHVIKWNTDKHYLRDLASQRCPAVPTSFVEVADDSTAALTAFLAAHDAAEFVVKPSIGAGSRDTLRYRRSELGRAGEHIARLTAAGRSVVLQPYLESVDRDGETAMIYFRGAFSHAIRKGPLLKLDNEATRALFAPEHITARTPSTDEFACAELALAELPSAPLLYARIDLIRDGDGAPCILEVELTEPSLFFDYSQDSAGRFVDAALAQLGAMATPEL